MSTSTNRAPNGTPGCVNGHPPESSVRKIEAALERQVLSKQISILHPDPDQPRKQCDRNALLLLGESLRKRQIVPCLVRLHPSLADQLMLIDGHRRREAAELVGMTHLDVILLEGEMTAAEIRETQLLTFLHAEGLNPFDLADALHQHMKDKGIKTQAALATHLGQLGRGKCKATISRVFKTVERLAPELRHFVEEGAICPSVAYHVSTIPSHDLQREAMTEIIRGNYKRDAAVRLCRRLKGFKPKEPTLKLTADGVTITLKNPTKERGRDALARFAAAHKRAGRQPDDTYAANLVSHFRNP